jgi:protein tyrosine/serine phosphatase
MRRFLQIAATLVFAAACGGVINPPSEGDAISGENLSPAIELVEPGMYRGHRPDLATLKQLKSLGVRTVLDLEDTRSVVKQESGVVKSLGMTFISEPMSGFWAPNDAEVSQIEAIMADHSRRPIFVHCQHGEDRTGLIVGLYRVETEHWSPATAYHEMIAKGFHKILFFLNHYYEERTGWED